VWPLKPLFVYGAFAKIVSSFCADTVDAAADWCDAVGMSKRMRSIPKVVLLFQTNEHTHRDILSGVLQYERIYGPWSLRILEGRQGERTVRSLASWRASAVIGVIQNPLYAGVVAELKVPTLLVDPADPAALPDALKRCSAFFSDAVAIGEAAADYFLARGFTRFAYVGAPLDINWSRNRGMAFSDRVARAGFACRTYEASSEASDDYESLRSWIKSLPTPTAVFAAWDVRGRQVLDICLTEGIQVPSEMAVLAVDNEALICETTIPTLSSIHLDSKRMGYEAAKYIDELMRKKRGPGKPVVRFFKPLSVVTRASTEGVNNRDPIIRCALEFIWLNAHDARLNIPHVAVHAGVSRRTLEVRFRHVLGKSPLEELQRTRLNRAKDLLRTTNLSVADIAHSCGFANASHVGKLFRAVFGTTMTRYRKSNG
jgi:LacI family transcriptional regulator